MRPSIPQALQIRVAVQKSAFHTKQIIHRPSKSIPKNVVEHWSSFEFKEIFSNSLFQIRLQLHWSNSSSHFQKLAHCPRDARSQIAILARVIRTCCYYHGCSEPWMYHNGEIRKLTPVQIHFLSAFLSRSTLISSRSYSRNHGSVAQGLLLTPYIAGINVQGSCVRHLKDRFRNQNSAITLCVRLLAPFF